MRVSDKRSCIDVAPSELSVVRQCQLINEEYARHPFSGSRRMTGWFRRQGYRVNRKRIQRLMGVMGLRSILLGSNTSKPRKEHKKYPYLYQGMVVGRSNQVWVTDITYIRLNGGFVYLTAAMDWYRRFVLSWEISTTMETEFCISAVERAIRCYGNKPEVFNTDQGSQYTSDDFT